MSRPGLLATLISLHLPLIIYNESMLAERLTAEENRALMELKDVLNRLLGDRLQVFVLYGSKARSDWDSKSDIDIAIVVKGLTGRLKRQILDKVAEVEFKHLIPISTLVLSEKDFNYLKERERRIALDIEKEGIPL